ncbi:sporulation peptidase YabG [Metallumcola ferriviriculae]|uniref:Sporulation peptidase YabG n=1 Tax=Metallumcola ferriviriculae TaxID=3039180 RepID=A0AAU0UHL4_9FIRM|nr:sporulation peptidase YabG [Desulfitibacteraceae bacterium MK1]
MVKKGDIVGRISYGNDVLFKVIDVRKDNGKHLAEIKGLDLRLLADAPVEDLQVKNDDEIEKYRKPLNSQCVGCKKNIFRRRKRDMQKSLSRMNEQNNDSFFEVPGRVLHIDGDAEYLEKCMETYKELNIRARGEVVAEQDQPKRVSKLLLEDPVDIVVLTGHDGILKGKKDLTSLDSYRNSRYFVEAVRAARRIEPSRDDLVVFAGACQSHYEAILGAGANFASSPLRVLIHAFDPVFIVEKVAFSSINDKLSIQDVIVNTITGTDGVGGIETRGRHRLGYPKSPY